MDYLYAAKMYTTDPEENEREGNFDRNLLQWGANRGTGLYNQERRQTMKRTTMLMILSFLFLAGSIKQIHAQQYTGMSGLIHVPSADME